MKRLLLGLMLGLTATVASAEWTKSAGSDEYIQYVDRATIRQNGNFVKMWELRDFKTVQTVAGISLLSGTVQSEYDCKEERSRRLTYSLFSGEMGNGKVIVSDSDPSKWEPIAG